MPKNPNIKKVVVIGSGPIASVRLLSLITPEHRRAVLLRKRDCALSSSTQTLQPS